jgi:quercetin dioxygenase-like cupin family protein
MKIIRANEGEIANRTGQPIFEGDVRGRTMVDTSLSKDVTASYVFFQPGARTRMHRHTSDQILLITSGTGQVGTPGEQHDVSVGDCVFIPANEDHWHGAGDTGLPMAHVTVLKAESQTTVL